MIIVHEYLDSYIEKISEEISKAFGFNNIIISTDLSDYFRPVMKWKGDFCSEEGLSEFADKYNGLKSIIFTPRDIYVNDKSREDDWIFGYNTDIFSVVAVARMKRFDSKPSRRIVVSKKKFLDRMISTAMHEISHDMVKGDHLLPAKWVDQKNNYELPLGPHCTDNRCVLYEIVDIIAPPKEEGHMLLGEEKKYDTGLDECIERQYEDYFCKKCKDSIVIDNKYR